MNISFIEVPNYPERRNLYVFFGISSPTDSLADDTAGSLRAFSFARSLWRKRCGYLGCMAFLPKDHPNTNTRIHQQKFDRIMLISGVILLIGELYKQLMNFYVVNDHVYDWWIFPFQLCSLPMYLCPLLIMIHNAKRHRFLCTFLLDFNMMGAVATFIDPSGIFHPYWMLTLHGILWHLMLIFVGFVIIFSHEADLTTRGFLRALPLFAFFCLAAEVLNGILHRFSAANLFYISPWEMSTQLLFGDIDRILGRPIGILLYILAMAAGAWLIHNVARKITAVCLTAKSL